MTRAARLRRQAGAALLAAMLTVAMVATLAAAGLWQQWRSVEVEAAERARAQARWILTGALDWARLILREDARAGGADHLAEPWAVPLEEARLSTFLAADRDAGTAGTDAENVFLSGDIVDLQSRLNINNLVEGGKLSETGLRAFRRLFEQLGLPAAELDLLAENLRQASDLASEESGSAAPLMPQRVEQLAWLGVSPQTVAALAPHVSVLPARTPVNLNTAGAPVIYAALDGVELAEAQQLVAARDARPFRTLADATRVLAQRETALGSGMVGVSSRFFEIRGRLRLDDVVVQERSLVQRDGLIVRTLQRDHTVLAPGANGAR
ncbi:type II secretion system minor pseudopilin GspK [Ramlibacter rhizophilus]|uniref:Type II secretion system protein K n=1 Tax=Ramlibacter rhizophilus TaxID=1781167 RepID=A0A4Z0BF56_9BURK|nr:type II secretion system minor pseudopilin GspK [Ramlibacter rhizophilus]TFY97311.1 general secretion pathway protein GspK [Ramlibacter rhizophilus]